jgi:hypothetical protein
VQRVPHDLDRRAEIALESCRVVATVAQERRGVRDQEVLARREWRWRRALWSEADHRGPHDEERADQHLHRREHERELEQHVEQARRLRVTMHRLVEYDRPAIAQPIDQRDRELRVLGMGEAGVIDDIGVGEDPDRLALVLVVTHQRALAITDHRGDRAPCDRLDARAEHGLRQLASEPLHARRRAAQEPAFLEPDRGEDLVDLGQILELGVIDPSTIVTGEAVPLR